MPKLKDLSRIEKPEPVTYFSEREEGEISRENEEIDNNAWGGIQAHIQVRIDNGSFGACYPTTCNNCGGIKGTNEGAFERAMKADIPNLQDQKYHSFLGDRPWNKKPTRTLDILDIIEFCWRCIGKPISEGYHDSCKHYHLDFDIEAGQNEFRNHINGIFRRNGLAYELTEHGHIERLAPPVLREELASDQFPTGDAELDRMLETARCKFCDPNEVIRREALESLWDAWERLKTLGDGSDKKTQITSLLDQTAGPSSPKFREALEMEANELTRIGNHFQIRHSERDQERLARSQHVDYLFHRLFAFIQMILKLR